MVDDRLDSPSSIHRMISRNRPINISSRFGQSLSFDGHQMIFETMYSQYVKDSKIVKGLMKTMNFQFKGQEQLADEILEKNSLPISTGR